MVGWIQILIINSMVQLTQIIIDTTPITSYPSFYQNSTGVCKTIELSKIGLFDNAFQITIDQSLFLI